MPIVKCKIDKRRLFDLGKDEKGKKIVMRCPKGKHNDINIYLQTLIKACFKDAEMFV